ncbi:MAG: hypothetical protein MRJ65_11025 [Candidatus Brocadiaceae bacterium]|nr:hypothetical protein [Candidatus Brocadiaceae bacterium]
MKTVYVSLVENSQPTMFDKYRIQQWYFFSPDFLTFLSLEQSSPSFSHYIDIGEMLQKKAWETKNAYINLIGQLGRKYLKKYPLAWWISYVAERNEMSSHAFLNTCYYEVFRDLKKSKCLKDKSLILVDSIALFHLIMKQLKVDYRVVVLGKPYFLTWSFIRSKIAIGYRFIKFLVWIFSRKFKEMSKLHISQEKKAIFVRTWVTDKTISSSGELQDVYFPGLYEFLGKKGYDVFIIPNFHNITLSPCEIQRRMNRCKYQFMIPEKYLSLIDYFGVFIVMVYQACFLTRIRNVECNGEDISSLLAETQVRSVFSTSYIFLAQMYALKNLSQENYAIESFIYTYENMFPEKPLSYAVKKYFPDAKAIGFQHSVLYPLQLCLYPAPLEWEVMPLPDRIVFSGKFFSDIYLEHGAPQERLAQGPALRFKNIISTFEVDDVNSPSEGLQKGKILIAFPLAYPDALELATKSARAIGKVDSFGDLTVGLKTHPMMPLNQRNTIHSCFHNTKYCIEFIETSIDEILHSFSVLITMASGVVFDAIARGVPVIRVGRSTSLNFDPADFIKNNPYNFTSQDVEELSAMIYRLLQIDDKERLKYLAFGKQFVKESFNPVTEEFLSSFVVA